MKTYVASYCRDKEVTVRDAETVRFVMVLPKLVPGKEERLKLVLDELNGNCRVELRY